jgi:hypothetical protein
MSHSRTSSEGFRTYLFSYSHEGARWSLEIQARDPDDARARLNRLAYATYDGELVAKIPAFVGIFARLAVTLRNAVRS